MREEKIWVPIMYEKLPKFYFTRGKFIHDSSCWSSSDSSHSQQFREWMRVKNQYLYFAEPRMNIRSEQAPEKPHKGPESSKETGRVQNRAQAPPNNGVGSQQANFWATE